MKHLGPLVLLTMAACALPCAAQGQVAFTAKSVNVRAGPARDYPVVALVPAGYQVAVQGCLPDYSWCDVLAGPTRGWVYGGNINYSYQNTYVPVLTYGAVIGVGVLAFALDDYWGRHYRHRSWYGDRHRWANRREATAPHFDRPSHRPGLVPQRPPQHFNPPDRAFSGTPAPRVRSGPNPPPEVVRGAQQPGTVHPRVQPQQRVAPNAQRQPAQQGSGSGWSPSQSRGQGRVADQ